MRSRGSPTKKAASAQKVDSPERAHGQARSEDQTRDSTTQSLDACAVAPTGAEANHG